MAFDNDVPQVDMREQVGNRAVNEHAVRDRRRDQSYKSLKQVIREDLLRMFGARRNADYIQPGEY